jgi:hypothetical protein
VMIARAGRYQPGNDLHRVYAGTQAISMSSVTLVAIRPSCARRGGMVAVGGMDDVAG